MLEDSGARWAFADEPWCEAIASGRTGATRGERVVALGGREHEALCGSARASDIAAVESSTPAWLFYTSGTTGRPKGVVISHGNLVAMAQAFLSDVEAVSPGDALLHPAPLSHGSGLYLVPHVARGAVNVVPESGGFDADEIVALLDSYDRALFFAAPTMVRRLVAAPAIGRRAARSAEVHRVRRRPDVRRGLQGGLRGAGSPARADLWPGRIADDDHRDGPRAGRRRRHARRRRADRLGGRRAARCRVRIADAEERALPAGTIGEVQVRGATVMQGYWRNPSATADTLAGGWLHTGDLGVLDADGFLTLKDRSKDLIISGGSNIYPREVEEALLTHRDVAEVAVVGRRHPRMGRGGRRLHRGARSECDIAALERALDAHCLERIARFKRPKAYVFLTELPKNETGKVLKTALRAAIAQSGMSNAS